VTGILLGGGERDRSLGGQETGLGGEAPSIEKKISYGKAYIEGMREEDESIET